MNPFPLTEQQRIPSGFLRSSLESMKILVAGDTNSAVESLRAHFLQKGCRVETAYASVEIRNKISNTHFDIFISSFLRSDEYALRMIKIIRRQSDIRLLFLTRRHEPEFSARALNLGVDDCIASPVSFFELDARVFRLCSRNENLSFHETKMVFEKEGGMVEINLNPRAIKKNGVHIALTKIEYKILLHLAFNKGKLVSKKDLEKLISRDIGAVRSLSTHILNLRRKISPILSVKTISCQGFILFA